MQWNNECFVSVTEPSDFMQSIVTALNKLNADQALTAKITMSDRQNNDAHGLIFYDTTLVDVTSKQITWKYNDFTSQNIEQSFINTVNAWLEQQDSLMTMSRICMTERLSGNAHIIVFYPDE